MIWEIYLFITIFDKELTLEKKLFISINLLFNYKFLSPKKYIYMWKFKKFLSALVRNILSLRYSISLEGIENIQKDWPFLILPNHPWLIDPLLLILNLFKFIDINATVTSDFYDHKLFGYVIQKFGWIRLANLQNDDSDIKSVNNTIWNIIQRLNDWKNVLLYPSWAIYAQWFESIIWKKSVFNILSNIPDNVKIILVRTTGLWGSNFTKASTGKYPNFTHNLFKWFFYWISNLFFRIPKRNVKIYIEDVTKHLMEKSWDEFKLKHSNLNDLNKYLENFYNKHWEEEIVYKKHFWFYDDVKNKVKPTNIERSLENIKKQQSKQFSWLNQNIEKEIIQKISEMKAINSDKINLNSNLILDLYCDSLDLAELKSYVLNNYKNSNDVPILDLNTVGDFVLMAMWKSKINVELKDCKRENLDKIYIHYKIQEILKNQDDQKINILELIKLNFNHTKNSNLFYDNVIWNVNQNKFMIMAYLFSNVIKKQDGKYIWIMHPSLISTLVMIVATYLAWKVPVMLNWTLSKSSFDHCMEFVNLDTILTSNAFYSKVKWSGILEKYEDKMIFAENIVSKLRISDKIWALIQSKLFVLPKLSDVAVILFTSWSENLPKAVPLTHQNIIQDLKSTLEHIEFMNSNTIMLSYLPPFHSFWFSAGCILPLIGWIKTVFTPDPRDGNMIVELIKHTQLNLLVSTPIFLRIILDNIESDELKDIEYAIVGAEPCSKDLLNNFSKYSDGAIIFEWYWITECSPVVSANKPWDNKPWSIGKAISWIDLRIVDLENHQKILWKNEQWLIILSGKNVFEWYLDNTIKSPFIYIDDKKYYNTWDLWYIDEDGFIFITWRLKRFIKIGGEMISLPMIESTLNKKYWTETQNVLAVEAKEDNLNTKIILFTILDLDLEEVNLYLRDEKISNLIKISEIKKLDEIPVLWTWKIDYKLMKDLYL